MRLRMGVRVRAGRVDEGRRVMRRGGRAGDAEVRCRQRRSSSELMTSRIDDLPLKAVCKHSFVSPSVRTPSERERRKKTHLLHLRPRTLLRNLSKPSHRPHQLLPHLRTRVELLRHWPRQHFVRIQRAVLAPGLSERRGGDRDPFVGRRGLGRRRRQTCRSRRSRDRERRGFERKWWRLIDGRRWRTFVRRGSRPSVHDGRPQHGRRRIPVLQLE